MKILSVILIALVSISFSTYERNSLINGEEEYFTGLFSGQTYYFILDSRNYDKLNIRVRLQSNYSISDLSLYYFKHDSYNEAFSKGKLISPEAKFKGGYLNLEDSIDISNYYFYATLVVKPDKYINYIYVKLKGENEARDKAEKEISKYIILVIIIPLCIFGIIILIALANMCFCRSKKVVIQQTIPPKYEPPAVQTMNAQQINYQQPSIQMQYILPPTQQNNQYNPPPY